MQPKDAVSKTRRRIAVVSPFLDKRHGTERAVVEPFSRLADEYDVHVYSQNVEDMDLNKVHWHRIPTLPGPHIFNYLWWFGANHLWRWYDRWFHDLKHDAVFSPGVNCVDADLTCVHIVFAEFRRQVREELAFGANPAKFWPRLLHRRIYYRLIESLESMVYRRRDLLLSAVSHKVADELTRYYGRDDEIYMLYHGIDAAQFSPQHCQELRQGARDSLGIQEDEFALLMVGNDWKKKGLTCLIEASGKANTGNLRLLIAGRDDAASFLATIEKAGLSGKVSFLPPRRDVEFYYAAADAYVGPSLDDSFAFPPLEAAACGLPVVTSRNNGGSEIVTHGQDGLVLEDPNDRATLTGMIRQLASNPEFCRRLGDAAALATLSYTWERNAQRMRELLEQSLLQNGAREKLRRREAS